jgi:hypothetical protein
MARILIIEDELEWFKILRKPLAISSNTIDMAQGVDEAKYQLEKYKYNAVITDPKLSRTQKDLFETFGTLIFSLNDDGGGINKRSPFIIVTGYELERAQMIKALNNYPGWIWGWHEKGSFDQKSYSINVNTALEARADKTCIPRSIRHILSGVLK